MLLSSAQAFVTSLRTDDVAATWRARDDLQEAVSICTRVVESSDDLDRDATYGPLRVARSRLAARTIRYVIALRLTGIPEGEICRSVERAVSPSESDPDAATGARPMICRWCAVTCAGVLRTAERRAHGDRRGARPWLSPTRTERRRRESPRRRADREARDLIAHGDCPVLSATRFVPRTRVPTTDL